MTTSLTWLSQGTNKNRSALRAEVVARGFDYLPASRIDSWLQDAVSHVVAQERWHFTKVSITVNSSTTGSIAGGGLIAVENVSIVRDGRSVELPFTARADLLASGADLLFPGEPTTWFIDRDTIRLWPVGDAQLSVSLFLRPLPMSADGSTSGLPAEFDEVLIDYAAMQGEKDRSEWGAVTALREHIAFRMAEFRELHAGEPTDQPRTVIVTQEWA